VHSLGNFALRCGFVEYIKNKQSTDYLFNEILHFAADEDWDAFDKDEKYKKLTELAKRITVYFNLEDGVLKFSMNAYNNKIKRLGNVGPENTGALAANEYAIDATRVIPSGLIEHEYYIEESCYAVQYDMYQTLKGVDSKKMHNRTYKSNENLYIIE
jgi:esterase/lipase superfamily enzyme